jgi:hypothetical protein
VAVRRQDRRNFALGMQRPVQIATQI